ncbi:MAG: triose-phosphate isomerase [Deltaproteobacteria bacterium]|nr:triose-phosphate isomerase [Deltaproteobacteria bacterium]MDQ3301588.1 triose-phosphate isomerase [Myxococcota bacterium]
MRTPFVVGNWKLNKTIAEALALVTELKNQLGAVKGVAVGVAPTFVALPAVAKRLEGSTLATCAQDCFWESSGAWTGEVSAAQLADAGATWAIVGHSERRQFFGDRSDTVGKKARAALAAGLGAIVCVGESLAERDGGKTLAVVDEQLDGGLVGMDASVAPKLVIAYEPVWAIGTGRTATPGQAQEVHAHIRKRLADRLGAVAADAIRIQYGGSVKPSNAEALMAENDIDGALVGGASLEAADFIAIVKAARSA